MKEFFYISCHNIHIKNGVFVKIWGAIKNGDRSLWFLGLNYIEQLPEKVRFTTSVFMIKTWFRPKCNFNLCSI